ncbi:MAG TPA: LytTR family DNA-binding domain-containing protein [Ideonella sp.]|nr:LytTR family DNA-binding domain-containing protein [Ideonella sp.]
MTTALIADDEPHLARYLAEQLKGLWPELVLLPAARNGLEAAEAIARLQPDLAFLDIKMPGLTGLDVAQGIEGTTRVVFVTAYDEFAVQAFDQAALDYLLKPVTAERLGRTVERLKAALATTGLAPADDDSRLAATLQRLMPGTAGAAAPLRWIRASAGDTTHQVAVDEVLFFRADDKYTCVQTAQREHVIRTPIAELAAQLDPQQFWQVHRATLINVAHLESTRRDEASRLWLRLRGHPQELPVSRAYVALFKAM